ncbi:ovochymase-1 [Pelodytes ibericus]
MKCGVQRDTVAHPMEFMMRIVGGRNSVVGGQPWTVSVQLKGRHICGGSIVQKTIVVTAAHCVYSTDTTKESHLTVIAGDYDHRVIDPQEQTILVSSVVVHPEYRGDGSMSYDIALLYLSKNIRFGSQVQPVCLPQVEENVDPGTVCISSGWGRVSEDGGLSTILQEVKLPVIDNVTCSSVLASMGLPTLHDTMLCAGFPDGGKDACQGDSGGPLVCRRRMGSWFLVGISSWGLGCGRTWGTSQSLQHKRGSPAVFSRVSALLGFLRTSSPNGDCSESGLQIGGESGIIKYPLNSNNYPDNSLCRWHVTVHTNKIIQIKILQLAIEYHVACTYDYLSFSVKDKMISKVCGFSAPSPLLIPSNEVIITFFSDDRVNNRGFKLHFTATPDQAGEDSGCGSIAVLKEEGAISSANYPALYPRLTTCHWIIEAPEGKIIKLTFEDFAVEIQKDCAYDHVSVYDDGSESRLLARLCGFTLPPPVLSPKNTMLIHFSTDQENNYPGFKAHFNFLPSSSLPPDKLSNSPVTVNLSKPKPIPQDVCGIAPLSPRWMLHRIVGGEDACPNCWPWQVGILFLGVFQCGGVVISPYWVLSAAHCIQSLDPSHWLIAAGKHDRLLNEPTEQRRTVRAVIVHDKFDLVSYDYDMGMLLLEEPLDFNDYVRPICMPTLADPPIPSSICVVTGWGNTQDSGQLGQLSSRLQQLEVPILDTIVCNRTYYQGVITERMFCAGFPSSTGRDSCQGDSGGPLVCQSVNNTFVLYGIVSWGVGCGRAAKPGVYSRVQHFLNWIRVKQEVVRGQTNPTNGKQEKEELKPLVLQEEIPIDHGLSHHRYKEHLPAPTRTDGSQWLSGKWCKQEEILKGSVGSIASPGFPYGYPGSLNCSWVIRVSPSGIIKIVLDELSIADSPNCVTEYLSIYKEDGKGRTKLAKHCGFLSSPEEYKSQGPVIRVTFHTSTKGSHGKHGFALFYRIYGGQVSIGKPFHADLNETRHSPQRNCSDVILTSDNGVISSPGYPSDYPNDLNCQWRIIAPRGSIIRLDLLDLKTERDDSGCQDHLRIYEGAGQNKKLIGTFCGMVHLYSLKSDGQEVTLAFTSNPTVTLSGFTLRYSFWELHPGCPILDLLPAGSAEIRSPCYPETYPDRVDCQWIIYSTSGKTVKLQISDLSLEESTNCTWDYLRILDGPNNVSSLLVSLCGHKTDLTVQSSGSYLTVQFHSDKSLGSRGFRIQYGEARRDLVQKWRTLGSTAPKCGETSVDPITEPRLRVNEGGKFRVVGGESATSKSWPWIVSIQTNAKQHFCGGTIIGARWILTAAHCEFKVGEDRVFVGQTDLSLKEGTEVTVINAYAHRFFEEFAFPPNYDISLLELKTPIITDKSVAVICLPERVDFQYADCMIAGWGSTNALTSQYPHVLQQAKVPIITQESCQSYWGTDVTQSNVCAGGVGSSSCMGDSGGPLICKVGNRYTLVGVVSWGSDECELNAPAVYTLVAAYRDWITEYTGF